MTQKEAFEFLELPENSSKSQIKIRLVEKLEYFEHLSEHAASDFLRRIHAKNMEKVRAIQQEFFPWSSFESGSEVVLPIEETPEENEEAANHTIPIIISAGSKKKAAAKKPAGPPAWLVSHNENQPTKAYSLLAGKNYIGRKLQEDLSPFIVLENDPYVSRVHAVLFMESKKPDEAMVMDSAASNNGQPSKNGTYINGNTNRIAKKELLKENDTIQIGNTKLVFKLNTKDLKEIIAEVDKGPYVATVSFD